MGSSTQRLIIRGVRKVAASLPLSWFAGAAPRYGFILGLHANGTVIHKLQDSSGEHYAGISSVVRHGDALYLGSLLEDAVGVCCLHNQSIAVW